MICDSAEQDGKPHTSDAAKLEQILAELDGIAEELSHLDPALNTDD